MDMGQHVVQDYAQPLTLYQVVVPGLEDRARTFPRLSTARQLSSGGHMSNPERLNSINCKVIAPRSTIDSVQHLNLHAWLQKQLLHLD